MLIRISNNVTVPINLGSLPLFRALGTKEKTEERERDGIPFTPQKAACGLHTLPGSRAYKSDA